MVQPLTQVRGERTTRAGQVRLGGWIELVTIVWMVIEASVALSVGFATRSFRNEVVWQRTSAHNDPQRYGANIDILLYYTKGSNWTWNQLYTPHNPEYLTRFRHHDPDGRLWTDADLTAKGLSGGGYEYEYKGVRSLWRCPEETMRKLDAEGRLHFTSAGGIRLKRYLEDTPGIPTHLRPQPRPQWNEQLPNDPQQQ
jgi:hypothetical protein